MATSPSALPALGFNIDKLLEPVSPDNPVGEDLSKMTIGGKSMAMAQIEEKRRAIVSGANENIEPSAQVDPSELARQRRSEWREVEKMLLSVLEKGRELGAAISLAQAAVASRGWLALAPCVRYIRDLQERFGEALYPVPETEDGFKDFGNRLALLGRLDHTNFLPLVIRQIPITDIRSGGEISWSDFRSLEILKSSPVGKDEDPDARRRSIEERSQAIEAAVSKTSIEYLEAVMKAMEAGAEELNALKEFVEQNYADSPEEDRPAFNETGEALEECKALAWRLIKQKGGGKAAPEEENTAETGQSPSVVVAEGVRGGGASSDQDVVRLLEQALAYLRMHQRHNPAAFLVQEAIRWTKMPIANWYLEASEDPSMSGFISKLMRGASENSNG